MNKLNRLLLIAAASFPISTAAFAAGDAPSSPNGFVGRAPANEVMGAAGAGTVAPSFGAGSATLDDIRATGASVMASRASFPPNGLGSVAYGSMGRGSESVINWDSRTRAYTVNYPNSAIVFIEINGSHLCTGWMYAPNMVATAGHCVHTGGSTGAWRDRTQMRVHAGRDGAASPFGSCTVARLHSVTGWTASNNFRFDYGAMRLNCSIGNTVGWFGMYTPASPVGQSAIIGGYPGDKPRTQWTSADKIREVSDEMLAYRMDTIGGHSGSPIWHDRDEGTSTTGAWAIGVHNYGVGAFGSNTNAAARLTSARITNYINWRNQP